jgi:predicted N-acyltransferase
LTNLTKTFCAERNEDGMVGKDQYLITLHDSIYDIEESWSHLSAGKDIFLGVDFLKTVELCPPSGIKPYYGLVSEGENPVGLIYFQSKYVKLKENLRSKKVESSCTMERLTEPIKEAVIGAINFQTIVCGNMLLTGKYGFHFTGDLSRDQQFYIVSMALEKLQSHLSQRGVHAGLILIKDFFSEDMPESGEYHQGFTKFTVQPKMVLDLRPEWRNFDDYQHSLKSKYRVRARKALIKASDITKRVFTDQDLANHREKIHSLYKNVSDQADFNAFILHEKYFERLQANLGKHMKCTTYWRNGEMVAFYTSIKNMDVLDAHFLGYEPNENIDCQLYLNMLYDLIKEAIEMGVSKLDLSRTAIEIKSTIGAQPLDMYLYLKHTNAVLNKTVATVLSLINPTENYIIRNPFKDSE